jgi:cobalt-zinc-cadmium efflux system protein
VVSRRPATQRRSYGQHRFQVLAALINGVTLVAVAAWIGAEAVQRLFDPVPVMGAPMLVIAAVGLAVNIAAFLILHGGNQENLNMRGAVLHVMGDLMGSVAAIVAAGVILWTGWTPIDPILSVLVALLILRSAWTLVGRSWHVLMEGTPEGLDVDRLRRELTDAVPGVEDVHHVHAWCLTPERPLITFHASLGADADHDEVLRRLRVELVSRFNIEHSTIQLECAPCAAGPCAEKCAEKSMPGKKSPQFNIQ